MNIPIWFQLCYAVWQFIRYAKLFKLAYGTPYHLVLYWVGKVTFAPFSKIRCGSINAGKKHKFSVQDPAKSMLQKSRGLVTANLPRGIIGNFGSFHYILPESKLYLLGELSFNKPDVLTLSVDYITKDFCVVNYDDQKTLLEKVLDPNAHLITEVKRVLLYPSEDSSLNQNFIRILSIMPLVLTSKGMPTVSTWFTVGLIFIDVAFNALLQSVFQELQRGLVLAFRGVLKRIRNRKSRYTLSLFLLSASESMRISDTLAGNFYDLEQGSLALLNNFADPYYCEVVEGVEFGESNLTRKPSDEIVSEAFRRATGFSYYKDLTHYVEVETKCGKVFMGYNPNYVCIFPVSRPLNLHSIALPTEGIEAMLKVMGFINEQKSNLLDISRDGYAHSVSISDVLGNTAEISSLQVVRIKRRITVAS